MVTKKVVWVTVDGEEFETEIEAENHEREYRIMIGIQKLLTDQKIDPCDWAPADAAMWIAKQSIPIVQIINESLSE